MNLYKRPMFMQQGGAATPRLPTPMANMPMARAPSGAMPPMRPSNAPMAPAPRIPAAPSRPKAPADRGIGSMIADKAKADLATAQGPEELINAFRGNKKPISARYQELAEYVGPNDAGRTPTSVLTMVQPTIMLTEKGAADSGIGQLMAGMPQANAPMQGNMGAGIMRQAPVKMQNGGDPRMADFQSQQAFLQQVLGLDDAEALRRRATSRGLMQAGLQGLTREPRLGESAAQQILPTVFEALGAGSEADMAVDQLMRQSVNVPAAQYALDQEQARKAAAAAAAVRAAELEDAKELEKFKAGLEPSFDVDNFKRLQMPNGDVRNYNLSNPADQAAYAQDLTDNGGIEIGVEGEIPEALKPPEAPQLTAADIEGQFADSELLNQLQNTQVTMIPRDKLTRLNAAIQQKTQKVLKPTGQFGPTGNEIMTEDFDRLPEQWDNAILAARGRGIDVQLPEYLESQDANPFISGAATIADDPNTPVLNRDQLLNLNLPNLSEPAGDTQFEQAIKGYPISNNFGTWAAIDKAINTFLPATLGILGPQAGEIAAGDQEENDAETALQAFEILSIEAMLAARPGRASNETRDQLKLLFPNVNAVFTNRREALGKYKSLRGSLEEDLGTVNNMLAGNLSRSEREKYIFVKATLEKQLNNLSLITRSLEGQGADATRVIPPKKLEETLQRVIDAGDISANYPLNITFGN